MAVVGPLVAEGVLVVLGVLAVPVTGGVVDEDELGALSAGHPPIAKTVTRATTRISPLRIRRA